MATLTDPQDEWAHRVGQENTLLNFVRGAGGSATIQQLDEQRGKYFASHLAMAEVLRRLVEEGRLVYSADQEMYSLPRTVKRLSTVNLEPMPGKVIVRLDTSDKQVGGLWIIRNAQQSIGQIVAIYDDFDDPDTDAHVEPFLRVEDWVIFGQHSGVKLDFNRETYIILRESEILCRVIDPEVVVDRKGVSAT